ncbi:hypothetical protein, partial [Sporolactobacillus spathodeae]
THGSREKSFKKGSVKNLMLILMTKRQCVRRLRDPADFCLSEEARGAPAASEHIAIGDNKQQQTLTEPKKKKAMQDQKIRKQRG